MFLCVVALARFDKSRYRFLYWADNFDVSGVDIADISNHLYIVSECTVADIGESMMEDWVVPIALIQFQINPSRSAQDRLSLIYSSEPFLFIKRLPTLDISKPLPPELQSQCIHTSTALPIT